MSEAPYVDQGLDLQRWFAVPDRAAWEAEATRLLKGRPLSSLTTALDGGVPLPPLFGPADPPPLGVPDRPPYRRGSGVLDRRQAGWDVRTCVDAGSLAEAREQVAAAAEGGARSVWLVPDAAGQGLPDGGGLPLRCDGCLDTVLGELDLGATPVHLSPGARGPAWVGHLRALAASRGVSLDRLTGAVPVDPLGVALRSGDASGVDAQFDGLAALLGEARDLPWVQLVGVSTVPWATRGADPVLELAGLLTTGAGALRALLDRGVAIGDLAPRVLLQVTAGRETFVEVAKLRAVRWLWAKLIAAHGGDGAAQRSFVHAVTSPALLARRDPWNNLLRQSHGAFAAAVAGADAITMLPWDRALGVPEVRAQRLAATSQRVLLAEAHLAQVADPAGGSWCVEWLTERLARDAWAVMQEVEAAGGLVAGLADGSIAARLTAARDAAEARLDTRKQAVLGVSTYPNADEALPERAAARLDVPFREAGAWEALRDAADAAPVRPSVTLLTLGPLPRHKARLDFARQVFDAGGFAVTEAVAGAPIDTDGVCVCGHDADYASELDAVLAALPAVRFVVLAGAPPADRRAGWQAAGLTHAIHLGAPIRSILAELLAAVGVQP